MAASSATPRVVRFGLFELDLDSRELRKSGVKIKLQEQPFQILALLLERPGAIVTREELHKTLWAKDTFVEFDLNLNSAVKKLRQALNDDSENPRFVETLYRRGYRFIAPVNGSDGAAQTQTQPSEGQNQSQPEPAAPANNTQTPSPARSRAIVIPAAAAIALALIGAALWLRPSLPAPRVLSTTQITHDNLPKDQLVTDGPRLYFTETLNDHQVLSQVSAEGGEVAQIPLPFPDVAIAGLSPSSSELLIQSLDIQYELMSTSFTGPLWLVPLPAGSPRRLGNVMAAGASLSPDGKNLVYASGQDLFLAQADGSNPQKLVSLNGFPVSPKFSPDGTLIRFTMLDRNTGSFNLWEASAAGVPPRPLLSAWHEANTSCCGAWSPGGQYYFFTAWWGSPQIWALPERTGLFYKHSSQPLQVTNGPLRYTSPVLSRDGRTLFVVGEQPRAELLRYDTHAGQFTPFLSGISAGQLDFSRDAQFIAYVTYPDGALWRSRADGSDARRLSYPPFAASLPRWSPDGTRIAFSASIDTTLMLQLYVVSADGGSPQQLTHDTSREFADPTWAPDGNSLILSRGPALGSTNPQDFVLVRLDLKTGQFSELPGSSGLYAPRWSPDGRYLSALNTGQDKLMLLQLDTGQWSELAAGQDIEYPSWSRNSQELFFETTFNQSRALFRVNLSTRRSERVLSLSGIRRIAVPFGVEWSGLSPDNSALIMRDVGIREIYALKLSLPGL
jgi:Tol biopolymer transport system component/DNA-binding winged helix-turn-helix (wHTH) protein